MHMSGPAVFRLTLLLNVRPEGMDSEDCGSGQDTYGFRESAITLEA